MASGDKLRCANTQCKWNRKGCCLLFVGVSQLECQYRIEPRTRKPSTKHKKGK